MTLIEITCEAFPSGRAFLLAKEGGGVPAVTVQKLNCAQLFLSRRLDEENLELFVARPNKELSSFGSELSWGV